MVTSTQLLPVLKQVESGGNPNAVSPKGAAGAYQIMPATAANPGYGVTPLQGWDGQDPRTAPPEEQERFAREYLQAMSALHGGDVKLALASYNAGPGAVQMAGNTVPNYPETQNYVKKITEGTPVAATNTSPGNVATDWRARAQPVTDVAPVANDWRTRAQPVQPEAVISSDWRARAQPVEAPGRDLGAGTAAVQGFNSAVPFGERVTAGLGAAGAYAYDKATGLDAGSLGDYYKDARQTQEKTAAENPGSYTAGALTGVAATLPILSTKVLTGAKATTGVRGAVNAIPEALGAVGNYVRGGEVAADAGKLAKVANVGGKALRAAAVSAPAGALYSYGGSRNDLNSQGALDDAKTGATVSAALGAAVPIAGAALSKIPKPNVSQAVKDLAATAKDKFGIDLSLDQIASTNVRSTVQKISQNIPGSGVEAFQDKQATQWLRGVAKTIGEDADNLSPEVITNYLTRAGKDFEKPLAGKTINFTQGDINSLADVATAAKKKISTGLADVVQNNVDEVLNNLSQFKVGEARSVPGEKLASLRSQLLQDLPSIEGGARQQVAKIIDKIDEVVGRHLSPAEAKTLQTARLQWRNFRTIEPLLEKSTDGTINPTQLMQKVASSKYIKASRKAVGEDDLVDLARIGKQFMAKKGGSDTAQKLAYIKVGAAGLTGGAALQSLPATAVALGANRGYQKLINQSPKVVERLVKNKQGKSLALPIANLLGAQAAPGTITKNP
jgi:hypothetical protein